MERKVLVLWDVDHTLIETGGVGHELFEAAFKQATGQQLIHPAEVTGRTETAIFRETVELHHITYSETLLARYADLLTRQYRAHDGELASRGRALPGAADAIAALAEHSRVVQSVLTGNLRPVAEIKLKTFNLDAGLDLAAGAYGDDDPVRAHLVPIARQRAAKKYQTSFPVGSTILVGDSPSDIEAAHSSSARMVAVASGKSKPGDLRRAGAELILTSLRDTQAVVRAVLQSG
jgi:phosphoglycolate phosphatase-like HAD superfamily hydrolase